MTDLEMTKLCAEAMGWDTHLSDGRPTIPYPFGVPFDPLHNDAHAMALVKKFGLTLNRAIVECVAKMQAEKK